MKLIRLFSSNSYKGEKYYLKNQLFYEIVRTVLLFALSAAIYLIGLFTTGSNKNILTIVAVLGCLPACKSAVGMIMFIRYKSLTGIITDKIEEASTGLCNAYDTVFTSYDKNFQIGHLVVNKGCILCFDEKNKINSDAFSKHINTYLKNENLKDITIKVFTYPDKYIERLYNLEKTISAKDKAILDVLLSISL